MKIVFIAVLVMLASAANATGTKKVEPGVPTFNKDGTATVEARVTDEDGKREECVFIMNVVRDEKDGQATVRLVEKSSDCSPAHS
jgi:hypothetical protein